MPVIQIGKPGERGSIEWSDMIVATQGATPGAVVIQYNLDTTRGSGLWDVHTYDNITLCKSEANETF